MITDLIMGIATTAQAIYNQAETAKANTNQCKRLASRVQILAAAVKGLEHVKNPDSYRPALGVLLQCLKDCEQFVQAHIPSGRFDQFKAFVTARGIKERFTALSDQLEKARGDLGLALDSKLVKDHEQGKLDAEADRKMLVDILAGLESAQQKLDELKVGQRDDRSFAEAKYEHTKERQLEIMAQLSAFHEAVKSKPPVSPSAAVASSSEVFYGTVEARKEEKYSLPGPRTINIGFKIPDGKNGNFIGFSVFETATVGEIRCQLASIRSIQPAFHLPGVATEADRALSSERTRFVCTKILAPLKAPPDKHALRATPQLSVSVAAQSRSVMQLGSSF